MPGKLGRTSKERPALLRGLASQLLWYADWNQIRHYSFIDIRCPGSNKKDQEHCYQYRYRFKSAYNYR